MIEPRELRYAARDQKRPDPCFVQIGEAARAVVLKLAQQMIAARIERNPNEQV